jgi:hypothetical protein
VNSIHLLRRHFLKKKNEKYENSQLDHLKCNFEKSHTKSRRAHVCAGSRGGISIRGLTAEGIIERGQPALFQNEDIKSSGGCASTLFFSNNTSRRRRVMIPIPVYMLLSPNFPPFQLRAAAPVNDLRCVQLNNEIVSHNQTLFEWSLLSRPLFYILPIMGSS